MLKPVHFVFWVIIMVNPLILCFPSFLTITYHFPWCFCIFPLVFLRFPWVILLIPLNISPVSYFRFCGSRFPAFNFLSFSSAFLCISSTFFLFLSVSLSVIFLSCCLLSFSFDFLCLSSTFSFCFCLFICLVLPSWLSFSFFICVFSIIFLNFLPISFHLPFLLIFLPSSFYFFIFFILFVFPLSLINML